MKKLAVLIGFLALILTGCDERTHPLYYDDRAPASPTGLVVYNGDQQAEISWYSNRESDLAGYNVFRSDSYNGKYSLIGNTRTNYFLDRAIRNGNKYYYAVTAYDVNGNESDLSYDAAYAAPRPEGFSKVLYDASAYPLVSGWSFAQSAVFPDTALETDFYYYVKNGVRYLMVWPQTYIQDMGSTVDLYDIQFAPETGWSRTNSVIATVGHTYVINTMENNYAKIRITAIGSTYIKFDWAYQLIPGETSIKPVKRSASSITVRTRSSELTY